MSDIEAYAAGLAILYGLYRLWIWRLNWEDGWIERIEKRAQKEKKE